METFTFGSLIQIHEARPAAPDNRKPTKASAVNTRCGGGTVGLLPVYGISQKDAICQQPHLMIFQLCSYSPHSGLSER